jgi:hypothetical protein
MKARANLLCCRPHHPARKIPAFPKEKIYLGRLMMYFAHLPWQIGNE